VKRTLLNQLNRWKNTPKRKPLILRGARQVGKTYLLKEFGKKSFKETHYLNFEKDESLKAIFEKDLNPIRILNELQFKMGVQINLESDLVIFDEIQQCPKALTSLKYFNEEMPDIVITAAGSLLGVAMNLESFPVGKVTFLDLNPLSFEEYLMAIANQPILDLYRNQSLNNSIPVSGHESLWNYWKNYMIVGGLPEAVKSFRDKQDNMFIAFNSVRKLQEELIEMYVADIAKHSGKMNALHIERVWKNVPLQLAKSMDGSGSKFTFKDVIPGIRGYERLASPIEWLEKADLLIRTRIIKNVKIPLKAFTKENLFKQYFFDVGLLGALSQLDPKQILDYDYGTYKGYMAENFVAQEFKRLVKSPCCCWQGRTSEVEFLLETSGGIIPIEVKSGHIIQSKSLKVFEEKYSPVKSVVLSGKNISNTKSRYYIPVYFASRIISSFLE
jgi:hypothetical protein